MTGQESLFICASRCWRRPYYHTNLLETCPEWFELLIRPLRADPNLRSVLSPGESLFETAGQHIAPTFGLRLIVIHVRRMLRCLCKPVTYNSRRHKWPSLCEHCPVQLQSIFVTAKHGNMYPTIIAIDCAKFAATRCP